MLILSGGTDYLGILYITHKSQNEFDLVKKYFLRPNEKNKCISGIGSENLR